MVSLSFYDRDTVLIMGTREALILGMRDSLIVGVNRWSVCDNREPLIVLTKTGTQDDFYEVVGRISSCVDGADVMSATVCCSDEHRKVAREIYDCVVND